MTGTGQYNDYYNQLPYVQLNAPVLQETENIQTVYSYNGYQVPIAACLGDTITFAVPHGLRNVVDRNTRLWIPNSNGGCNNVGASTLNGAISAGASSFTVNNASGWQVPAFFVIDQEVKYCTTIAGNTLSNCGSAALQVGSGSAAHSNSAPVVPYVMEYVMSTPTATTARVYPAMATMSNRVISAAHITVDDGNAYVANGANVNCSGTTGGLCITQGYNPPGNLNWSGGQGATWRNERGHIFTVAELPGTTFYNSWYNSDPYDSVNNSVYVMENFSASTGGTATIVPNNNYVRGMSVNVNSDVGSRLVFVSHMLPILTGAAGFRGYHASGCPSFFDRTGTWNYPVASSSFSTFSVGETSKFYNFSLDAGTGAVIQAGPTTECDYLAGGWSNWYAMSNATLMSERLLKYALQARMPAPDYGSFFLTHATTGSYGQALMVQSLADASVPLKVNLASYLVAGQPIIRECAADSGIDGVAILAAGTTSDTFTYSPGEFCAYLFPVSGTGDLLQPVLNVRLADMQNATKVVVRYAYTPMAFQPSVQADFVLRAFDCGAGACTLPVDRQISPIYYRLLYLDVNGVVLASSDVQTL